MPLTAAIVAVAAHVLTDLGWTECFLLGALLAPTDPVLSSSVVTNPRVPRVVRHSLNLESGHERRAGAARRARLHGGSRSATDDFVWWKFVLQDVTLGFAFGLAMGLLASVLMPRARYGAIPDHQKSLYALGVAVRDLRRDGAAAGGQRADRRVRVRDHARHPPPGPARDVRGAAPSDIVEIVKLGIFVVFGALLTLDGLFGDGWAAVGDRGGHAARRAAAWRSGSRWPARPVAR